MISIHHCQTLPTQTLENFTFCFGDGIHVNIILEVRGRGIQADGDIRGSQGAQVGNIPWSPGTHLNDPEAMRIGQPRERNRDPQFIILVTERRVYRPQRP